MKSVLFARQNNKKANTNIKSWKIMNPQVPEKEIKSATTVRLPNAMLELDDDDTEIARRRANQKQWKIHKTLKIMC